MMRWGTKFLGQPLKQKFCHSQDEGVDHVLQDESSKASVESLHTQRGKKEIKKKKKKNQTNKANRAKDHS